MIRRNMKSHFGKCYNNGFKYFIRVVWCAVSGLLFWRTYEHYKTGLEYVYLHEILGTWLCLARGAASVLNLNCAVVLLPMCHALIWLLNKSIRKININIHWLKMETKSFHIFVGYVILIMTGIHVAAHVVNIYSFYENFHDEFEEVNPFPHKPKIWSLVFETVAGVTGLLMLVLLLLIYMTSLKIVRRRTFNTFWYSHRIFVIFYILFVIHGFRGPLRKQLNVGKHIPGCHRHLVEETMVEITSNNTSNSNFTTNGFNETCSEEPKFGPIGCRSWIWVCVPVAIYLCDILCRIFRRKHSIHVSAVDLVCGDVLEISIEKPNIKLQPGQYVFVNYDKISTLEWHPFTVVQVPAISNGRTLKLWIKASGDWTEEFLGDYKSAAEKPCLEDPAARYPSVKLDGPYSSSMEDLTKYKLAVCIAGGVGITPFLSHISYLADMSEKKKTNIRHVYLIFVGRNEKLLERTYSVIRDTCMKLNGKVTVDVKFFYTGNTSKQETADIKNVITKGRPPLGQIFEDIREKHKGATVGVFACGPPALCSDAAKQCNRSTSFQTHFVFHKESF